MKKRTKKLLFLGGDAQNSGLNDTPGAKFKSFLLLFFKKEDFLPLMAFLPTWAVTKKRTKKLLFPESGRRSRFSNGQAARAKIFAFCIAGCAFFQKRRPFSIARLRGKQRMRVQPQPNASSRSNHIDGGEGFLMDAYQEAVDAGTARLALHLRILAAPSVPGGREEAASLAASLGFSHLLIPPPWRGRERRGKFLALDFEAAEADFASIAIVARAAKIGLLLDVQLDRLAAESPLVGVAQTPFVPPDPAGMLDPRRGVQADAALARKDSAGDALALAAWWAPLLRRWGQLGVAGFRLLGLETFTPDLAKTFFAALRQALPETLLLVWAPGLTKAALQNLRGQGVDGVFLPGDEQDWASGKLFDRAASLGEAAPVIGSLRMKTGAASPTGNAALVAAALIGQGFFYEGRETQGLGALSQAFSALPGCFANTPPRLLEGGGPVLAFLRQDGADHRVSTHAVLVVVNADANRARPFAMASVLPATGGVFGRFRAVLPEGEAPVGPQTVLTLKPGEARIFMAEAERQTQPVPDLKKSAAREAGTWPRLAIEQPAPAVDGGTFPVKAVTGEFLGVEADVVFDGHEKIAVALRWQEPGDTAWQEVPMRPLGNDRWQAAFPLAKLGRHFYEVCAWRDRFETFRDELAKKSAAGVPVALELTEGGALVKEAARRHKGTLAAKLQAVVEGLGKADEGDKLHALLAPDLAQLMAQADDRPFLVRTAPIPVDAERIEARFSSWYEVFPRSLSDDPQRHGTFRDVERHLPRIREMGFDVLYFPPIHPIGLKNRKGRNNTLTPAADDPGSPYAIGSAEGGHDALHPQLGTLADFAHLRQAAAAHGLELALDFAIQCSPDHPWLQKHPGWFDWRPDGSIKYAENPPKKYQDIVNVDFYTKDAVPDLWLALCDVVLFWAKQGVRLFRVDNPHTKPFPFWQWMIGEVRTRYPDAIFLAEAFTRPKVMYRLAKIGFSQSYTYFTWRNSKRELEEYFTELDTQPPRDFFRPHLFVNTPDINPVFLQTSGRPGFLIRAALAATLSGLWGVYNGFELCEGTPIPGREEYADSEKYQLRAWDWDRPGNIVAEISALNRMRRQNPALQTHRNVRFLLAHNDAIIYYEKATPDRANVVLVAVSLDPHQAQEADFEVPLWFWNLPDQASVTVENLATGDVFAWHGKNQHMRLTPDQPYAIWRVRPV